MSGRRRGWRRASPVSIPAPVTATGRSRAFTPLALDPVLWVSGSTIAGLADGAPVSSWPDISGSGRHLVQATGDKQPTCQTGELNSLPVVRFDGTDDALQSGAFTLATPCHVFIVAKIAGGGGDFPVVLDGRSDDLEIYYNVAGNTVNLWSGGEPDEPSVASTQDAFHIYTGLFNGAGSSIRRDGGAAADAGATDPSSPAGITLGAYRDMTTSFLLGDIAEVIAYASALADADRDKVEAYLAAKYGL